MRQHSVLVAAASLGMSASLAGRVAAAAEPQSTPRRHPLASRGFDPNINRWTGQPHEHRREIARRLRQKARQS